MTDHKDGNVKGLNAQLTGACGRIARGFFETSKDRLSGKCRDLSGLTVAPFLLFAYS
jgi:hypothetical protein